MARRAAAAAALLGCGLVAGCGSGSGTDGRTQVEFFQFKAEAVATFDALIEQFEDEHPDIDIVQNNVPSADAALRTRLVKNDVPPLITINGNGATYGDLAIAGIFRDFTGDPALDAVTPESVEILNELGTHEDGETNGVPFATNANGILYNVAVFEALGLEVPRTWEGLLTAAEKARDAGVVPFYHTWKEPWTLLVAFNGLAPNVVDDDFWEQRSAGETTFADSYGQVAEKMLRLRELGPDDPFRFDYNTGNRAMADGEAAMYIQGNQRRPRTGRWRFPATRSGATAARRSSSPTSPGHW